MYTIHTPNAHFCGVRFGITFRHGVASVPDLDGHIVARFELLGYRVTTTPASDVSLVEIIEPRKGRRRA